MKRIWTMLLAALMLCSSLVIPAMAAGEPSIKVAVSTQEAIQGDELTAELIVSNNPGVAVMNFSISYDKTRLELTGYENGQLTSWTVGIGSGEKAVWVDENGWDGNGSCLKLKFRVLDNAKTGAASITISNLDITDIDENEVTFSVTAGSVTVKPIPVPATGITLNKNTLSLITGNEEILTAERTPTNSTDTIVWSSSDNSVVTVDSNGKVVAVGRGTATITAKANNAVVATCKVTVTCSHANKALTASKESNCAEKGWDAYYTCNACGQLFSENGDEISTVPYRALSTVHTEGTPATCQEKAICSVCHQPYGDLAPHSYTAETQKEEALKAEGTCKAEAIYYYSCAVCGRVENNDSHVFLGSKNADNHDGGTTIINDSLPNHVAGTNGYTGDVKCLGCGEIIANGSIIPAGEHVASGEWLYNEDEHWQLCGIEGCNAVVESTKTAHDWVDANCTVDKHCSVCGISEEGTALGHEYSEDWMYDAQNHWHKCVRCEEKSGSAAHEFEEDECVICRYNKSSVTVRVPEGTPGQPNPTTGAVVNGVVYAAVALAAVGAVCIGVKKRSGKNED